MLYSYLAACFLFLIILLAFLLLAPFHLLLNFGKNGPQVEGSIKLAWLGLLLMKTEITPLSAGDLLASIRKEEKEESEIDNQIAGAVRSPRIRSLFNAAPALAKILRDLLKSIRVKKFSSRLCFGLDDPAQTAIVSGYIWFLASALGLFPANIFIEPCFDGERLEGELVAEIEVRLLWAVFAVFQVMRMREIRLLLREMLRWG